jgi:tetratricopeptide (TPR) repeat protein
MGKTRPPERNKLARRAKVQQTAARRAAAGPPPSALLADAAALLARSDAAAALDLATRALQRLQTLIRTDPATGDVDEATVVACLPALNLLGEACVELGDVGSARKYFGQAADIDEDGSVPEDRGGGADKFLWLAQLSDEGGAESLGWLEKAARVLRAQIEEMEGAKADDEALVSKKAKLANALCALVELFMTDLSWEDEAEARCSEAVEEAVRVAPDNPETLQTMASVRISQCRVDEARGHLRRSLELWRDLPPGSPKVPDFAVRISLARLLMDAEMERDAAEVLGRLVLEDDTSVEAWYLGGWCANVMATKAKAANGQSDPVDDGEELLKRAKKWLEECLVLYEKLEYEDEPLRDHARELLKTLGDTVASSSDESGAEEWEDESDNDDDANDSDEDMDDE